MQTDELLIFASEKLPLQDALFIPTHVIDLLLAKQNFPLAFFFFCYHLLFQPFVEMVDFLCLNI